VIKTLVSIEVDLASSFAIRYACQLSNLIPMELYPVYVKFPSPEVPMTGVGWVRHTWEREIVATGREEIKEVLAGEMESCPLLQEPQVIYGDREYELLQLMQREAYDLYIEGAPYPFTPVTISKRLRAKFYQHLTCPLIWLRGVRKINQALALCLDLPGTQALVKTLDRLWQGCSVPVHLGYPHPESVGEVGDLRGQAEKARETLAAAGCQVSLADPFSPVSGGPPPELLKDYGLVAVALEKGVKKDSPELQWLAQLKAPLLLVLV
jgi:hypothetical protein